MRSAHKEQLIKQLNTTIMTWKYVPLLNVMIQILVTIGLGGVMARFRIFKADEFVPLAVRFVFYVSLPCLVLKVSE